RSFKRSSGVISKNVSPQPTRNEASRSFTISEPIFFGIYNPQQMPHGGTIRVYLYNIVQRRSLTRYYFARALRGYIGVSRARRRSIPFCTYANRGYGRS